MRSANSELAEVDAFWAWFDSVAAHLGARLDDGVILAELERRLHHLDPDLSWEVGPGRHKLFQLVVSPNLDRDKREAARRIVAAAPLRDDWEFHAARQPRDWNYRFELVSESGPGLQIDASSWTFVLLRYPDRTHEVLLQASHLPPLSDEQRWDAAAIVLEAMLGEDVVVDRIDRFELLHHLEPRLAGRARPIAQLREALIGPGGPATAPPDDDR